MAASFGCTYGAAFSAAHYRRSDSVIRHVLKRLTSECRRLTAQILLLKEIAGSRRLGSTSERTSNQLPLFVLRKHLTRF